MPHAVIDLDWLRNSWPSPPGDRFNLTVELTNLTAVAATYLHAGARRLVLSGVLQDATARRRYAQAVDMPLQVARLIVELLVIHQRLHDRHAGQPAARDWHLHRSGQLARDSPSRRR